MSIVAVTVNLPELIEIEIIGHAICNASSSKRLNDSVCEEKAE